MLYKLDDNRVNCTAVRSTENSQKVTKEPVAEC